MLIGLYGVVTVGVMHFSETFRYRRLDRMLTEAGSPPRTDAARLTASTVRLRLRHGRLRYPQPGLDLDVIFLGTAGSVPTASRITSATLIRRGGERILVDCGEGAQRRLMQSAAGLADIELILLTHAHTDHYLGLPGLLKTFDLRERTAPLALYGPPGTRALVASMAPIIGRLSYPVRRHRPGRRARTWPAMATA